MCIRDSVLASQEFWFTAIAWTFIFLFDFTTRKLSDTYFKEQEESENKINE
jgi:hypothetical protein